MVWAGGWRASVSAQLSACPSSDPHHIIQMSVRVNLAGGNQCVVAKALNLEVKFCELVDTKIATFQI